MKVPVEKNKEYIVDIIDNGMEGEGIAKIDGFTIFIPNAIKGEKIKILELDKQNKENILKEKEDLIQNIQNIE